MQLLRVFVREDARFPEAARALLDAHTSALAVVDGDDRVVGLFTDDDLLLIEGKAEELAGIVQKRYGVAKDDAQKQADDFLRGGVFSCYRAVDPATPIPPGQKELHERDWIELLTLAQLAELIDRGRDSR